MTDRADLRALSDAATPGLMTVEDERIWARSPRVYVDDRLIAEIGNAEMDRDSQDRHSADAAFIGALWNDYRSGRLLPAPVPDGKGKEPGEVAYENFQRANGDWQRAKHLFGENWARVETAVLALYVPKLAEVTRERDEARDTLSAATSALEWVRTTTTESWSLGRWLAASSRPPRPRREGGEMDTTELSWRLCQVAIETPPCHWISTPNGDEGREWCPDCGSAKVRNLRRRDRKHRRDYILDGGWRTSHDSMPICAGCGAILDGSLTRYGAQAELDYYTECGLSTRQDVDALYLGEILDSIEGDNEVRTAAELAVQLLAQEPTPSEKGGR